jgi:hypothetical protein
MLCKGTVSRAGKVILSGADVDLTMGTPLADGGTACAGTITWYTSEDLTTGYYTLTLDDGRSGEINVTRGEQSTSAARGSSYVFTGAITPP